MPTLVVLAVELAFRSRQLWSLEWYSAEGGSLGARLAGSHALAWVGAALHSAILWGSLVVLAGAARPIRHVGAGALFTLFTAALGAQTAFRSRWAVYLSRDATELSAHPVWSVFGSLRADAVTLSCFVGAALGALASLFLARKFLRPGRRAVGASGLLAIAAITAALFVPVSYRGPQATTPDLLWFNAVSFAVRGPEAERVDMSSAQLRAPLALRPLQANPSRSRNVVLILQESQRADVTCIAYDADCTLATPFSNVAAKERLPLLNLRANGSATTIAMNGLFTGLPPTAPAEVLRHAPNLFEIAAAAGYDTAYFTSHHLMFANMWLLVESLPRGRVALGTHLDPRADMWRGAEDALLTKHVAEAWSHLREPFFIVVHYSNIHAPRHLGHGDEPFQPASDEKTNRAHYFNGYKNTVRQSDEAVGALIDYVRASASGDRTVLVYTADHGESNGEHGQGCDHGCTVFDEEVRVPGWVDAPASTLSDAERAALSAARMDYVFHTDVAPTLLDLLGLWDNPALADVRGLMIGEPLTRALPQERLPVPLSNVSYVWERGLPSYGLMSGRFKLIGRHREPGYHCYDIEADPMESRPMASGCEELMEEAQALYGIPPSEFTRLADRAARQR